MILVHLNMADRAPKTCRDPGPYWVPCCYTSALDGPADCTCWEPVHDLAQAPALDLQAAHEVRSKCCGDCAYRLGSSEREGDRAEELQDLTHGEVPFWCHVGIRRVTHRRHPDGRVWPAEPGDYDPPIVEGVPYRADGRPLQCAGWATLHAAAERSPA